MNMRRGRCIILILQRSLVPNLDADPAWACTEEGPWQEESGIRYCFCTYERREKRV